MQMYFDKARRWLIVPGRTLAWIGVAVTALLVISVPADNWDQIAFAMMSLLLCSVLGRSEGDLPRLMMIALSMVSSGRYMYWRLTHTLSFDHIADCVLGIGLLLAETYSFVVLLLGYVQVLWPLHRQPAPLPADPGQWPTVDVLVPTYNEPLELVKTTLMAALALDWPADKIKIYLLDDGRREAFRELCESLGVEYMVRGNNRHAKAGNINAALARTHGEFVAIFDCDHMATRSFLQLTMGWFLKDRRLALMQTPHYYFSPDPMERNLGTFGRIPNEGELFYGLLQDGNDLWDATFFCGSCAVLRRTHLESVGGVATETVTEDAHTALKLHRRGYRSAYLAIPQASGLATESLSGHVGQRIRWARGMIQIFRVDNPLLGKGLTLAQRLCYLNAMLHFLYGLPRLIFLTAPLASLLFGLHVIHTSAVMLLAYAGPHVAMAYMANHRNQGRFRHLLWNEVYETVLAWYILLPTLLALINPKLGKFNVTSKGGLVANSYFDAKIARPYIYLLLVNLLGILAGMWHLYHSPNAGFTQTMWINVFWTIYNIAVTGAAIAAARESKQMRGAHRVEALDMMVALRLPDDTLSQARVTDFSVQGMAVETRNYELMPGLKVQLGLSDGHETRFLPAMVVNDRGGSCFGLSYEPLTSEQQTWLVNCTFACADQWAKRWGTHEAERPFRSIHGVAMASLRGLGHMVSHFLMPRRRRAPLGEGQA